MAFSNTTFLLAFFLFACLAFARPVKQKVVAKNLVSDVCSKTINPPACLTTLRSDPRSAQADLRGLGHISIGLARNSAKTTIKLIDNLVKGAKVSILKERLATCSENYNDSISDLDDAERALNLGDFSTMNIKASAAADGPSTCGDEFNTPPAEPPQLKKGDQDLEDICSAVLVISNMLGKEI